MYDIDRELAPRSGRSNNFLSRDSMSSLDNDDEEEDGEEEAAPPSLRAPPARGSAKRDVGREDGPRPSPQVAAPPHNKPQASLSHVCCSGFG